MNDFLVWVGSECGTVSPVEDADDISGVGDAEPCVLCEHAGCEASVIGWDRFWAALSAEQVRLGIKPDPAPRLRVEIPHVWDVDGQPVGVVHEMRLEGDVLVVRDGRIDVDGDGLAAEVRMPFTQAVHVLLNLRPHELAPIEHRIMHSTAESGDGGLHVVEPGPGRERSGACPWTMEAPVRAMLYLTGGEPLNEHPIYERREAIETARRIAAERGEPVVVELADGLWIVDSDGSPMQRFDWSEAAPLETPETSGFRRDAGL